MSRISSGIGLMTAKQRKEESGICVMVADERPGTSMSGLSGWINQWPMAERKLRYSEKV